MQQSLVREAQRFIWADLNRMDGPPLHETLDVYRMVLTSPESCFVWPMPGQDLRHDHVAVRMPAVIWLLTLPHATTRAVECLNYIVPAWGIDINAAHQVIRLRDGLVIHDGPALSWLLFCHSKPSGYIHVDRSLMTQVIAVLRLGANPHTPMRWDAGRSPLYAALKYHAQHDFHIAFMLLCRGAVLNPAVDGCVISDLTEQHGARAIMRLFDQHLEALSGLQNLPSRDGAQYTIMHDLIRGMYRRSGHDLAEIIPLMQRLHSDFGVSMLTPDRDGQTPAELADAYAESIARHKPKYKAQVDAIAQYAHQLEDAEVARFTAKEEAREHNESMRQAAWAHLQSNNRGLGSRLSADLHARIMSHVPAEHEFAQL
jgi:hypothetical protein